MKYLRGIKTKKQRLSKIIHECVYENVPFEELDYHNKLKVLFFIKNNNIKIRVWGKRGYDILKKSFFVNEYVYEDNSFGYRKDKFFFSGFSDYFIFLGGDIYESACYFGYNFSQEEVDLFDLELSKLNCNSFNNDNISQYTFDKLQERSDTSREQNINLKNDIKKWISKRKEIKSYKGLIMACNNFKSKFQFSSNQSVFFSLLMQEFGPDIKDYVIEFASKHTEYDGVSFADILFFYDSEGVSELLSCYVGNGYEAITVRRKKTKMRALIEFSENDKIAYSWRGEFLEDLQMYVINYRLRYRNYVDQVRVYFLDFEEFVENLNGDLSGVDLSKAPIDPSIILKYKTNEKTKLPLSKEYSFYEITKTYEKGRFLVNQVWFDTNKTIILEDNKYFDYFCDFVFYLNKDLSNADLLMCEGIENIGGLSDLNLDGILVSSSVAKALGISSKLLPQDYAAVSFAQSEQMELATRNDYLTCRDELFDGGGGIFKESSIEVAYVTDIHLLHRYKAHDCLTLEDTLLVNRTIANQVTNSRSEIVLIGGDIASDFTAYQAFICAIDKPYCERFITLGNHELWPFAEYGLEKTVEIYREFLLKRGMHLVHNNIYYFTFDRPKVKEIKEKELITISEVALRERLRDAYLIVFGGIGFAGKNNYFNAEQGIYLHAINRLEEIAESEKFELLHNKISNALYDKNVLVFSHMPIADWASEDKITKGFVYINGHNHRNYFYDDGNKRIYADNQIGYMQKSVGMKKFSVNYEYDWFADYADGIYEISRDDYIKFYIGINAPITFYRKFQHLYMVKKEGYYLFLMVSPKGTLLILDGGGVKIVKDLSLQYFYDNLANYSKSINLYFSQYNDFLKSVSMEIRKIGGNGIIHGCIVDIDYYNHLYIDPFDGSISPYFAKSIRSKYIYDNIPSLLKYRCPELYNNYRKMLTDNESKKSLIIGGSHQKLSKNCVFSNDTKAYSISNIFKKVQFASQFKVVRIWENLLVENASKEAGRSIVQGLIVQRLSDRQK